MLGMGLGSYAPPQEGTTGEVPIDSVLIEASAKAGNIQPFVFISENNIASHGGTYYFKTNGSEFWWNKGQTVEVSLNLSSSATLQIGYVLNGRETLVSTVGGKSPSCSFTVPRSGYYKIVIRNPNDFPVTILSGNIE